MGTYDRKPLVAWSPLAFLRTGGEASPGSTDAILYTPDLLSMKPQQVALFRSGPQAHSSTEEVLRLLHHLL